MLCHLLQGVSWCRIMKKWRAQFGYGGKCRNLGYFDDPADAVGNHILLHMTPCYYQAKGSQPRIC